MILITSYSHKLDDICFLADAKTVDEAAKMLCDRWNEQYGNKVKIVNTTIGNTYLLFVETPDDATFIIEDDAPRREGWILYLNQIIPNKTILKP